MLYVQAMRKGKASMFAPFKHATMPPNMPIHGGSPSCHSSHACFHNSNMPINVRFSVAAFSKQQNLTLCPASRFLVAPICFPSVSDALPASLYIYVYIFNIYIYIYAYVYNMCIYLIYVYMYISHILNIYICICIYLIY